ncbi:hypothetical protein P9112_003306 [Eukaryota sp. TZLM1-RC]
MKRDLEQHVRQCIPCQKNSNVPKTLVSSSGSLTQSRRSFEYLHCDTIGPFSPDSRKNKYVLHFVDAFSKFSILCPVPDIKSITVADAILSNVYATFGAPKAIHSDNGTEFCNAVFDSLCKLLNITHSTSIPHFHQSNGLVERQHRIILQNLRKVLLDFAVYDNWSDYLPFCQMIANSFRKSLNASPYELIFGSDTSPRLLPVEVMKSLELSPDQPDVPDYMSSLSKLSLTIKEKWNSVANNTPSSDVLPEPKFKPQPGSRVFVLREHPDKLHGHFAGPYIVKKIISRSSLMVENPITRSQLKTSIHLVKFFLSSLPEEILNAYVAADAGELLIDAILDISDDQATILWFDGTQSSQPVDTVKNTVAFQRYSKMLNLDKPRRRGKRRRRESASIDVLRELILKYLGAMNIGQAYSKALSIGSQKGLDDILVSSIFKDLMVKRSQCSQVSLFADFSDPPFSWDFLFYFDLIKKPRTKKKPLSCSYCSSSSRLWIQYQFVSQSLKIELTSSPFTISCLTILDQSKLIDGLDDSDGSRVNKGFITGHGCFPEPHLSFTFADVNLRGINGGLIGLAVEYECISPFLTHSTCTGCRFLLNSSVLASVGIIPPSSSSDLVSFLLNNDLLFILPCSKCGSISAYLSRLHVFTPN